MIQNYSTLKFQVDELRAKCGKDRKIFCQQIFSTAAFVCFKFRGQGENIFLYVGKGKSFEGIWLANSAPNSELRVQDKFLALLRKDVRNSFLLEVQMDEEDRIIFLTFKSKGEQKFYGLFWRGRKLYFAKISYSQKSKNYVLYSPAYSGYVELEEDSDFKSVITEEFVSLGRKKIELNAGQKKLIPISDLLELEKKTRFQYEQKPQSKKIKSLKRRLVKIEDDLKIDSILELIANHLNNTEKLMASRVLKIGRYKLKFETSENVFHRKAKLFELRKKLKRSVAIIEERKKQTQEELAGLEGKKAVKQFSQESNITPVWLSERTLNGQVLKSKTNDLFETHFLKESGAKIWVGLSARGNDQIRKESPNKEFLWFHLENRESSHLIISVNNIGSLSELEKSIIGSVIRDKSKLDSEEIDLVFCSVKDLKGIKGVAGSVRMARPKYLRVRYEENWKDYLSTS